MIFILCCALALLIAGSQRPSGAGASLSTPLDPRCSQPESSGGARLSAGLGEDQSSVAVVGYGRDTEIEGTLTDVEGRGVARASICIYANVVTEQETQLIGVAETDEDGDYSLALPTGPSRNLTAVYRSADRELSAWALLEVRAAVSLKLAQNPVHNKHFAHFSGQISGPDNNRVLVFLQVKRGLGWLTIRRYDTRDGGKFSMRYHFTRTVTPTTYPIRAQVVGVSGYPYETGNSPTRQVRVLP